MIKLDLLTPNEYSRPQTKLRTVKRLVIHWVANPGTTAQQNRNFFELRKNGKHGYGSTHFLVDDTEIIKCVPEDELTYHVGAKEYTEYGLSISSYPNDSTMGIEMCHFDDTGEPSKDTLKNTVSLLTKLCKDYGLNPLTGICQHNDITGKLCHKYYVDNPDKFTELKNSVNSNIG